MALTFPANPTVGQTYVANDFTYAWDGAKWTSVKRQVTNVFDTVNHMAAGNLKVGDWCKVISPLSDYVIQTTPADVPLDNGLHAREITASTATPLVQPRQTGDGTKVEFDAPGNQTELPEAFFVIVDGSVQRPGTDYLSSVSKITFVTAPANGANVDITYFKPVTTDVAAGTDVSPGFATSTGSTTARTLADRFSDVVNVKDFGAVGDGVADDTQAFEDALSSASLKGATVIVPSGDFKVTRSLFVMENVCLQGLGGTIIATTIQESVVVIKAEYNINRNFHSSVKDLRIINNGSTAGATAKDSAAIALWCTNINPYSNGDQVNHTGELLGNRITGNYVEGFNTGYYFGLNTFVERAYIHENNHAHLCIYNFYLDDFCEYTTISNSIGTRGSYGVYDNGASNCSIIGNQLTNNVEAGIYMKGTGRNTKKFIITSNHLNHNKRGVWIGAGVGTVGVPITECIISDNHLLANTNQGVVFSGGRDCVVTNNFFSGNADGDYDVYVAIGCVRITVRNNRFENTTTTAGGIKVVGHSAADGVDKPYHVINDNQFQGYSTQIQWDYPGWPGTVPLHAANSIVNGTFEYWNGAGKPPSDSADNAAGNVDLQMIPDGTICKNTATAAGELWLKATKPFTFDGSHGSPIFTKVM